MHSHITLPNLHQLNLYQAAVVDKAAAKERASEVRRKLLSQGVDADSDWMREPGSSSSRQQQSEPRRQARTEDEAEWDPISIWA